MLKIKNYKIEKASIFHCLEILKASNSDRFNPIIRKLDSIKIYFNKYFFSKNGIKTKNLI